MPRRRLGFTLIEILLVVVIMAILAGTLVPRFLESTEDAKTSSLQHTMRVLEAMIEVYRTQHQSQYPTIQKNALPQLTSATNVSGDVGESGAAYPFGPYILEAPVNPFDGSTNVSPVSLPGQKPTAAVGTSGGWQYDASNGAVWPNNAEYYQ